MKRGKTSKRRWLQQLGRGTYLTGLILFSSVVFFFTFSQQAGVGSQGGLTRLDLQTLRLAEHTDYDLLPAQLEWVESEHAGSAPLIERHLARYKAGVDPAVRPKLARLIAAQSRKYRFNPYFVTALIQVESTFRSDAISPAGALGLMQIRPFVAAQLARELGLEWQGEEMLFEPLFNVRLGMHYLAKLRGEFRHDVARMITAYNYGPTGVSPRERGGAALPRGYYRRVALALQQIEDRVGRQALRDLTGARPSI